MHVGPPPNDGSGASVYAEAGQWFMNQMREGKVPGFEKDEHGILTSNRLILSKKEGIKYPAEVIFQVQKNKDENKIYWFLLQKSDIQSTWALEEAWTTDVKGMNKVEVMTKSASMQTH